MSEYCKNCEALQQENEKLKEQLELNTANAVVVDYATRLHEYKQALDEIEKITKCSVDQDCCECPLCTLCEELCINEDNLQRIILDIISKAKGEGNNEG